MRGRCLAGGASRSCAAARVGRSVRGGSSGAMPSEPANCDQSVLGLGGADFLAGAAAGRAAGAGDFAAGFGSSAPGTCSRISAPNNDANEFQWSELLMSE